jgi:hypothetical protein
LASIFTAENARLAARQLRQPISNRRRAEAGRSEASEVPRLEGREACGSLIGGQSNFGHLHCRLLYYAPNLADANQVPPFFEKFTLYSPQMRHHYARDTTVFEHVNLSCKDIIILISSSPHSLPNTSASSQTPYAPAFAS